MKKTKQNIIKSIYCLIIVVLIVGCTKEVIVERNITINRTIYLNNTITINNTIPCNLSTPNINTTYDRKYVLSLIRQLKHYEKQQNTYFNDSECVWELNTSKIKLRECEDELCEFNSSWC